MTQAFVSLDIAVLTISDSRTIEDDRSGALICDRLERAGHRISLRQIHKDELAPLTARLRELSVSPKLDAIIMTGGTGLTLRDISPDAVAAVTDKAIPGFGELFRMLSYQEIGASTIQSRACAAWSGRALIFALPGSTGACALAMDKILIPQLDARTTPCNFTTLLARMRGETDKN